MGIGPRRGLARVPVGCQANAAPQAAKAHFQTNGSDPLHESGSGSAFVCGRVDLASAEDRLDYSLRL